MKVYILPLLSFMTGIAKGNEGGIAPSAISANRIISNRLLPGRACFSLL